jgi:hypothetical protein
VRLKPKTLDILVNILMTITFGIMVCLSYLMAYGKLFGFVILVGISFVACFWIKKSLVVREDEDEKPLQE